MPVVAEVVRSGFVESVHHGAVLALSADGTEVLSIGDVTTPIFPRSSNKPMQALAMLRAGLDLDGELLALASASHSGEDFHVDGVRRILAGAGLDESALQCPPDLPLDEQARLALVRSGGQADPIHMNCSGKHAAMLATCVINGWPIDTYRDPEHPLQQAILTVMEELAGEPVVAVGVDGCGAPVMAISLTGLARAFRTFALASGDTYEGRIADAFRGHPEWTSGTTREEAALMHAVPGSMNKGGADAVDAISLDDGRTVAVKIADGSQRARVPVTVAALKALGVTGSALDQLAETVVRGGGEQVGVVRAVGALLT